MTHIFELPFLRSHKNYRGADQRWIGLSLDVLRIYLNWNPEEYQISGAQTLADTIEMSMFEFPEKKGRKIIIRKKEEVDTTRKRKGYTLYEIIGFPDNVDFEDFKRSIDRIYRDMLNLKQQ